MILSRLVLNPSAPNRLAPRLAPSPEPRASSLLSVTRHSGSSLGHPTWTCSSRCHVGEACGHLPLRGIHLPSAMVLRHQGVHCFRRRGRGAFGSGPQARNVAWAQGPRALKSRGPRAVGP
eukprot:8486401-Pyramimonas_sp.AAC.1